MTQEMTWSTVSDESIAEPENKIIFDTLNDQFVGKFLGMREITPSEGRPFKQARFEAEGAIWFTNAGYNLKEGLKGVRSGSLVRVTFVSETDTGQESPMKIFRVEVAKPARPAARAASSDNS